MATLLKEQDGVTYQKPVRVETDPARLKGLLNETRWNILTALAERPRYPAQIADELGMHEQKVYYHVRALEENDLIEVVDREDRSGAVAKYYGVTDYGFVLELPYGDERVTDTGVASAPEELRAFIPPFIHNGAVNTRIVVGSPDPHGPHQVRARDGHFAVDLAMFLGQYGSFDGGVTVQDVAVKSREAFTGNMILLGGPLTNMVTAAFNQHLPVRFAQEHFPFRKLVSEQTGTEYTDDAAGFIARTPNPDDPGNAVMVVAGTRLKGTRAAVLALTQHDEVFADYEGEDKWGVVVQGKDMDGDGQIDAVDVLE